VLNELKPDDCCCDNGKCSASLDESAANIAIRPISQKLWFVHASSLKTASPAGLHAGREAL
jgi:hypothetical protein